MIPGDGCEWLSPTSSFLHILKISFFHLDRFASRSSSSSGDLLYNMCLTTFLNVNFIVQYSQLHCRLNICSYFGWILTNTESGTSRLVLSTLRLRFCSQRPLWGSTLQWASTLVTSPRFAGALLHLLIVRK